MREVTDPNILQQLNSGPSEVTDPGLLSQLNSDSPAPPAETAISTAPPATLWDKTAGLINLFKDPAEQSAKSVQAIVDAETFNQMNPDGPQMHYSSALKYRSAIDSGIKVNPRAAVLNSTLMQRVKQSWDIGVKQNQQGEIGYKYVMTGDQKYLDAMNKIQMPTAEQTFISEGKLEDAFRSAGKLLPMMIDVGMEGGTKGLYTGMGFGMAAALMGGEGPQGAVTIPAASLLGFKVGSIQGAFEASLRKEAGGAIGEILQFQDAAGKKIDPNIARAAAFGYGTIAAGIEVSEIGTLLKTIPGLNEIFSKAVLETVASKTVKEKLLALAGTYAETVASEVGQEVAQEATQVVFEELSKKLNNALQGTDIKPTDAGAVFERLKQTAIESAQGFAVIAAPGIGVSAGKVIASAKVDPAIENLNNAIQDQGGTLLGVQGDNAVVQTKGGNSFVVNKVNIDDVLTRLRSAVQAEDVPDFAPSVDEAKAEAQVETAIDELLNAPEITDEGIEGLLDQDERGAIQIGKPPENYQMQHRPNSEGPRIHDLLETDLADRDIYKHPEWFVGVQGSKSAKESIAALQRIKGKPNEMVTIYRSAPKGSEINAGDWVSLSKEYAKKEGLHPDDPSLDLPVVSKKVPASHVRFAGDSLEELGYYPPETISETEIVYHAKTKGDFEGGKISTNIGSDADIFGKGFYFGNKDYVAKYGTPEPYEIKGKFTTNDQWIETLKKYAGERIEQQRKLAREELQQQGYVGIKGEKAGVVWDEKAISKPPETTPKAVGGEQEFFQSAPNTINDVLRGGIGFAKSLTDAEVEKLSYGLKYFDFQAAGIEPTPEDFSVMKYLRNRYKTIHGAVNITDVDDIQTVKELGNKENLSPSEIVRLMRAEISLKSYAIPKNIKTIDDKIKHFINKWYRRASKEGVGDQGWYVEKWNSNDLYFLDKETGTAIEVKNYKENIDRIKRSFSEGSPVPGEILKLLPNPSRPSEGGGRLNNERGSLTLSSDSEIVQAILATKDAIAEARPYLEEMGQRLYERGAQTFEAWQARMKDSLGAAWENFKAEMASIWEAVKAFNERLGQRGSIGEDIKAALGEDPLRKAIKEIKARGGLSLESLRHQRKSFEGKKTIASTYSQEDVAELTRKHPGLVSKKGKANLDEIAELFGFAGGEELRQELMQMESKATVAKKAQGRAADEFRSEAALAKKGYEVGKGEIESYNLDLGDKLVIDGEEHEVTAVDENNGTLTLKNGTTMRVAADEMVPYTAIKKNQVDTTAANKKLLRETRLAMAETARVERNVKAKMRRATGQYTDANMVREDVALREVLKKSARAAQVAFRAGNAEGVAIEKAKMKEIIGVLKENNAKKINMIMTEKQKFQRRREFIRSMRDGLGLTDNEMRGLTKKNILFLSDWEFKKFKDDLLLRAAELAKTKQAKLRVMQTIEEKQLQKVDNYREAMKLPTINNMTRAELEKFNELLQPFHDGDVFYTKRQIEMVDRTEKLKGTRTIREAREVLAKEIEKVTGKPVDAKALEPIHSADLNVYRWDTVLAEQGPFFQVLVTRMTEAMLLSEIRFRDVERESVRLAKAAHKSRERSLIDKAIPQDKMIIEYLEAPQAQKGAIGQHMTEAELDFAHYVQEYYAQALDYLIKTDALERGIRDYFTHVRRSFLEAWKDDGFKKAFRGIFDNMRQDEAVFTILDGDTGNILPLEKFFANTLHRTGALIPSKNLTRAFQTYAKTFERKVSFDAIMDELAIFTDSLVPEGLTPRGLEIDKSLRTFVNQYINNKKGRRLGFDSALRQGGRVDSVLMGLRTFTSMLQLGWNVPMQFINILGEQWGLAIGMKSADLAKGTARMHTAKGKAVVAKYEAFTGISFWEKLTQPGKEITDRLMDTMFLGYHVTTVASNKQFLLGMMTDAEWKAGELSAERLAKMKIEMGRWRVTVGTSSLVGSTSVGKVGTQYKTWAIVMGHRALKDLVKIVKDLKAKPVGEALTTKEAQEIYWLVGLVSTVLIVGAATGVDDDDGSYTGRLLARLYREALSPLQAIDPSFLVLAAFPPVISFVADLTTNLKRLLLLEEYKNDHRLRGLEGLKKQLTPAPIRQLTNNRR